VSVDHDGSTGCDGLTPACKSIGVTYQLPENISPTRRSGQRRCRAIGAQELQAMKITLTKAAMTTCLVSVLSACESGQSVIGEHGDAGSAETTMPEPAVQDDVQPEFASIQSEGPATGTPGVSRDLSRCAELSAWPEAAECIGAERDLQDRRLQLAYDRLIDALSESRRGGAERAHIAWKLLQDEDESLEALLFDHLGPVGYFEAGRNEVLRLCERAGQLERYVTSLSARTSAIEASSFCEPSLHRCMVGSATGHESDLDAAYERLQQSVSGELGQQVARALVAFKALRSLDDDFEMSIQGLDARKSRIVRTCVRTRLIERYADLAAETSRAYGTEVGHGQ
jgi:uncharacterized protein YecT (DUF1311 family)